MIEKPQAKNYFRSRDFPVRYFCASAYVEDSPNPIVIWTMKEMGKDKEFKITSEMLNDLFDPCSPYEALSCVI
jgi:hypothetical protein